MNSSLGIIVIGRLLRTVFGVTWFMLLHRWVHMVVVAFGVSQSVILFWVVITIFTVNGLKVAHAPLFLLLSGGLSSVVSFLSPLSSLGMSTI